MDSGWMNLWISEQEPCWENTATQSGPYWLEVACLSPVSYSMTFKDYHLLTPSHGGAPGTDAKPSHHDPAKGQPYYACSRVKGLSNLPMSR